MYHVLIVDDELEIRQGMRLKINWEELGFRITGEASNGREAMELLENEPFDVVITDMNMPVMDGLSFLDACRRQDAGLNLIVITGYEDFQYAHAAVRHQASHYLLKPVARDELSQALSKVKGQLDNERERAMQAQNMEWQLTRYYTELKEQFLLQLAKGGIGQVENREERAKWFQLESWNEAEVSFLTGGLLERQETSERSPEKFRLPFELLLRELAADYGDSIQVFQDNSYPGLMHAVMKEDEIPVEQFGQKVKETVRAHIRFEPSIGIGGPVRGFAKWKESCTASLVAWHMADGELRQMERPADEPQLLPDDTVQLIMRSLELGDRELFARTIDGKLRDALAKSRMAHVKTIFQIFLILEEFARKSNGSFAGSEELWLTPEYVLQLNTAEKAADYLSGLADKLFGQLRESGADAELSVIEASRRFIDENYMYDLNLTALADKYNYNVSYFSELFKAKTGMTFVQYVSQVRMGHAMELLKTTTLSLWDISELTGFSNASYFSSRFKRMHGMSPSEYRQRQSEKNDNELPKK
ncbi:response regulator [Paenibacillus sp. HB172176]|uniref:response regulator n=1 Tax=Paenibacillus sp. HB172176 TaxID=2493690 RepID=UPI001439D0DF|nr:response regulator [Paenibacillus sp. HB172176]